MKNVTAWGANPHESTTKGTSHMAKRSAAQKAATKKMIAANKKAKGSNPSKGKSKGEGKKKKKNPSDGIKRIGKNLGDLVIKGGRVYVGSLVVKAIHQNVIPMKYRVPGDLVSSAGKAALGLILGYGMSHVKMLAPYAADVAAGGVVAALTETVDPVALPPLAFNLLSENFYLGELDNRALRAVKKTLGELDNRARNVAASPAGRTAARRAAIFAQGSEPR